MKEILVLDAHIAQMLLFRECPQAKEFFPNMPIMVQIREIEGCPNIVFDNENGMDGWKILVWVVALGEGKYLGLYPQSAKYDYMGAFVGADFVYFGKDDMLEVMEAGGVLSKNFRLSEENRALFIEDIRTESDREYYLQKNVVVSDASAKSLICSIYGLDPRRAGKVKMAEVGLHNAVVHAWTLEKPQGNGYYAMLPILIGNIICFEINEGGRVLKQDAVEELMPYYTEYPRPLYIHRPGGDGVTYISETA